MCGRQGCLEGRGVSWVVEGVKRAGRNRWHTGQTSTEGQADRLGVGCMGADVWYMEATLSVFTVGMGVGVCASNHNLTLDCMGVNGAHGCMEMQLSQPEPPSSCLLSHSKHVVHETCTACPWAQERAHVMHTSMEAWAPLHE